MSNDVKTNLYPSSTKFTRLSTVLRLMNLKAMNEWNQKKHYIIASIAEGNPFRRKYITQSKLRCKKKKTLFDGYEIQKYTFMS